MGQQAGWGRPPAPAPRAGNPAQQGWNQQGWNQPEWSQQQWGTPPGVGPEAYGPAPQWNTQTTPAPQRRPNLSLVLASIAAVLSLVLVAVVATSLHNPGGSDVAYHNEDYQVPEPSTVPPPLVIPTSMDEVDTYLRNNRLYGQQVASPVRCDVQPVDVLTATEVEIKRQMDALTACLTRVWVDPLTAADYTVVRPITNVYREKVNTPCGNNIPGGNAFYCPANQQLYYSTTLPRVLPAELRGKPFLFEVVMAHEYAHLLQGRTGLIASTRIAQQDVSSKAEVNQLNRRLELQADCLMGQFIRSVSQSMSMSQSDVETIMQISMAIGDDTLSKKPEVDGGHGLGRSRAYWSQMGLASASVGACNTFTADPPLVR
ncbi:neutral zinc metallopeptidase [Aestuariimicrobium ganziense]|uniref:neutral zinc metallopeptidase n=1 Tax=Aestuariimicrobium ganziense TaxID=2773677 RepID=UPI00194150A7|nr:neutral zinc metallopeptidase [Aestuariimicrobium ganziense]